MPVALNQKRFVRPPRLTGGSQTTAADILTSNGKGKGESVHAMEAYSGSRGIVPLIPDVGTRWRGVMNFTPRPLQPRQRTPVPI